MLSGRRLYHCSRCLRAEFKKELSLPETSNPDPISPPHPSLPPYKPIAPRRLYGPRIDLSASAVRKLPARNWDKYTLSSMVHSTKKDIEKDRRQAETLLTQLAGIRSRFFKDGEREKYKKQILAGKAQLPPIPAPCTLYLCFRLTIDAVACVIYPIPYSWLVSDVLRLVPFDRSSELVHPVVEGKS
jgi:hypothetical protein